MAVIHILDKHTAELIAAGEVVERPASVAKELLENAIDAGATQITLSILSGGVKQLQIADNGSGIEAEYIATAFVRHATSKIRTEQDLDSIHTLGFRGEALASIASVSRVTVLTRTEQDEFACEYHIEGGQELGMEAAARPVGTTITVDDLFYNTPARMKFLKKDSSEGTFVADAVIHAALSHPEISFRFIREGKQQFVTPGDGKLLSAAYAVLGRDFSRDLLPVEETVGLYQIGGLITPPRACRASRGAQHFFINGRYVKNRTIMAALENAYKGTLMQGKFPGAVLNVTMPAELLDVNVHPAKIEVRFSREKDVFDAVYRAVKQALAAPGSGERHFHFDGEEEPEQAAPAETATPPAAPAQPQAVSYAAQPQPEKHFATLSAEEYRALHQLPTAPAGAVSLRSRPEAPVYVSASDDALDMYPAVPNEPQPEREEAALPAQETTLPQEKAAEPVVQQLPIEPEPEIEPLRFVGEVFKTYIITQRGNEMCLIDKHAAHERILYEELARDYGHVSSQLLMLPVQVNLTAEEKTALLEHREMLMDAGVEVDDYGGSTVVVRSVPADVLNDDVEDMVVELAAKLAQGSRDALSEKTEWVLHSIACRAAVKGGDRNAPEELMHLAEDIMAGKVPPFCPHGRPVVLKLTKKELEKQFGRLV